MKMTARDLRTGLAFGRIKHAQLDAGGHENHIAVSLAGGWSVNGDTYKNDYLHPAFFAALFSDLVRFFASSAADSGPAGYACSCRLWVDTSTASARTVSPEG